METIGFSFQIEIFFFHKKIFKSLFTFLFEYNIQEKYYKFKLNAFPISFSLASYQNVDMLLMSKEGEIQ